MGIANRENNPRKNSEGYSDPTAFEALRNIDKKTKDFTDCFIHYFISVSLLISKSKAVLC